MLRSAVVAALVLVAQPAPACTFCGGDFRTRQTLRLHYAGAKAVLYGQLKNPRFDPKTDDGFTGQAINLARYMRPLYDAKKDGRVVDLSADDKTTPVGQNIWIRHDRPE